MTAVIPAAAGGISLQVLVHALELPRIGTSESEGESEKSRKNTALNCDRLLLTLWPLTHIFPRVINTLGGDYG